MKLFFSSKDIPELADKNIQERNESIYKASLKLTVPQKLILNLIKLVLLVPPFIYLARQEWGTLLGVVVISSLCYVSVFRPISFTFMRKHL
ncbi:DUF6170 family protein [Thalassotalea euphylliae]|uniref:Uncharacterized protein n=1 Tax=Thalassotalea euphylliae TaxID=1655234 RepID=A0A3E0UD15_9GAMM|nr:hypothetical protein DXX92_05770 [Thalassotalea euphylliae]